MRAARPTETSCDCKKSIRFLTSFCSAQARMTTCSFLVEMPGTSRRRSGLRSMTSSVSSPKRSTMRSAVLGPMPLIRRGAIAGVRLGQLEACHRPVVLVVLVDDALDRPGQGLHVCLLTAAARLWLKGWIVALQGHTLADDVVGGPTRRYS